MKVSVQSHRVKLLSVVAAISAMVLARDILGFSINKYAFLIAYIFSFCILNKTGITLLLSYTMPVSYGLPNTYIFIFAFIFLLIKERDDYDYRMLLPPLLLSAQELVLSLWYPSIDIASEAAFIATLFLLAMLCRVNKEDVPGFLCLFLFGTAFALAVVMASTVKTLGLDGLLSGSMRLGYDAEAWLTGVDGAMKVKFNPNEVGYYSLVALSCSCVLYIRCKTNRLFLCICSVICAGAGLMSQSRTWVIMVLALIVLQIVFSVGSAQQFRKAVLIAAVALITVIVFCSINPDTIESVMARFESSNVVTGGGRAERFDAYNAYFISSGPRILFGTGVVGYREVAGIAESMHNGIQQLYVSLGIAGAIVYIAMIAVNVVRAAREPGFSLVNMLPIIAIIAFTQSIQLINPWSLMLPLACGIAALSLGDAGVNRTRQTRWCRDGFARQIEGQ